MKSYNEELSEAFREIADLMSLLQEDGFRIRAYQLATRRLMSELRPITKKDTRISLMKIPGIGEALAGKILEYMKTGKIPFLEKLRREIPKAVRDMLKIPRLGPKRVLDLYINLGVKTKADILRAAKNGDMDDLPGFGEKLIQSIVDGIQSGQQKKEAA